LSLQELSHPSHQWRSAQAEGESNLPWKNMML
jgi:hypothetical protein